jgi:hypothetical protein
MISGGYARLVARWHWDGWRARHASIAVMDDRLAGRTGRRAGGINTSNTVSVSEFAGLSKVKIEIYKMKEKVLSTSHST